MSTLIDQLAELLRQEIDAYSRLLEIERRKEQAIIANSAEDLLQALGDEEPATAQGNALERQILDCRTALAETLGKPGLTLRELIAALPPEPAREFEQLRTRLFGLAEEIRRVNQTNYLLLKQSIELLDEILSAVLGEGPPANTYAGDGRVKLAGGTRETISVKA